ncbi:hypothetical protein G9C98_005616 [Cotesia typhae]|uniref:Uncharacterized protein n=1 Tax=Cotesia typhae TaxID=2053667 RepID=A0A8J5QSA0_9HYME|nr:hypothetical protein G9C98_005616 [Cotesia typhae]
MRMEVRLSSLRQRRVKFTSFVSSSIMEQMSMPKTPTTGQRCCAQQKKDILKCVWNCWNTERTWSTETWEGGLHLCGHPTKVF